MARSSKWHWLQSRPLYPGTADELERSGTARDPKRKCDDRAPASASRPSAASARARGCAEQKRPAKHLGGPCLERSRVPHGDWVGYPAFAHGRSALAASDLATEPEMCSVKVVAGPRNQRESRRLIDGAICLCALAPGHDGRKFAEKLDLQPAVTEGRETDLFDKPAQQIGGFLAQRGVVERLLEVRHFLPVDLGRSGMEARDLGGRLETVEFGLAPFEFQQWIARRGCKDAVLDGAEHGLDLAFDIGLYSAMNSLTSSGASSLSLSPPGTRSFSSTADYESIVAGAAIPSVGAAVTGRGSSIWQRIGAIAIGAALAVMIVLSRLVIRAHSLVEIILGIGLDLASLAPFTQAYL